MWTCPIAAGTILILSGLNAEISTGNAAVAIGLLTGMVYAFLRSEAEPEDGYWVFPMLMLGIVTTTATTYLAMNFEGNFGDFVSIVVAIAAFAAISHVLRAWIAFNWMPIEEEELEI